MILDRQRSFWGDSGLPGTGIFPKNVVMMAAKLVLTVHPFKRSHSEVAILEHRTQRIDGRSRPHLFSLGSGAGPPEIETRRWVSAQMRRIWSNIENPRAVLRQLSPKFRLGKNPSKSMVNAPYFSYCEFLLVSLTGGRGARSRRSGAIIHTDCGPAEPKMTAIRAYGGPRRCFQIPRYL